jgi:hypothetical protein
MRSWYALFFFSCHVPASRGIQEDWCLRWISQSQAARPAGGSGMTDESDSVRTGTMGRLSAIAVAVVATLGLLYIVSQFLRNSVGVIAPNLADEIGLSPIEIGLLSSIYFFVFAATQLPLGVRSIASDPSFA